MHWNVVASATPKVTILALQRQCHFATMKEELYKKEALHKRLFFDVKVQWLSF